MTVRNLDALFRGTQIIVLGIASNIEQYQLLANLDHCGARSRLTKLEQPPAAGTPWPQAELAILLDPTFATATAITELGARGCKALLWAISAPPDVSILNAAKPYAMRILGPRSAGVVHVGNGLNLSSLPLAPKGGSVALIAQSQSIAAGAVDWAVGRGVGFSWIAVTGAEVDVDAADLLDYAALDPKTRAVVLQVSSIRHTRKFMSAARAAARTKPVLVLQTQRSINSGPDGPDPVRSAAFERAGMIECETLGGLFDGLVALELLPAIGGSRIAVIGNGSGVCALGINAVLRQRLMPARLAESTLERIAGVAPEVRHAGAVVDLGHTDAENTVLALRLALADGNPNVILFIHSPTAGEPHEPLAATLARAALGPRLLTVWLGLETAAAARRIDVRARTSTFPSADEAVRAVRYRAQHRLTQELLTRTPPADTEVLVDVAEQRHHLARIVASGSGALTAADCALLFTAYGLADTPQTDDGISVRISAKLHPELGIVLGVDTGARQAKPAYGFAPLDELLARKMLTDAACIDADTSENAISALTLTLQRIGKLLADQPLINSLEARFNADDSGHLGRLPGTFVQLAEQPLPERLRQALSQYPSRFEHELALPRGKYEIRPIRPSDEPAVLDLLRRLDAEEIRLRFFNYIRHFSHDMAARLTQIDYDRELTLIACPPGDNGEIVALATLIANPDGSEAEYAVLVHHDHTKLGLGRHLMHGLLEQARQSGIRKVYGEILAENGPMLTLARRLGFTILADPEDPGCKHTEFFITPGEKSGPISAPPAITTEHS